MNWTPIILAAFLSVGLKACLSDNRPLPSMDPSTLNKMGINAEAIRQMDQQIRLENP